MACLLGGIVALAFGIVGSDRPGSRPAMIIADAVRCSAMFLMALSVINGRSLSTAAVGTLGLLSGAGEGLFEPAYRKAFAELVPTSMLMAANGLREVATNAMRLTGAAAGGVLASTIGPGPAVLLDALTFAVSIACLAGLGSWVPGKIGRSGWGRPGATSAKGLATYGRRLGCGSHCSCSRCTLSSASRRWAC